MTLRQLLFSGAALIASGACVDRASAQTTGTTAPAAANAAVTSEIGEVVVTARRRVEKLQDVPSAVQAYSQRALTEKAIVSPYALAKNTPGLVVDAGTGNPAVTQFSIRGRGLNYGAAAGSVETYFAEVPLSAPFGLPTLPAQFFDVSSLDVLKGPQGTLFGRSTTGGAVLVTPQAPTKGFGGYLRVQGGDYGDFQAEGAVNIPIVPDKVTLRIAGFDWQRDGYMHTTGGTNEITGAPLAAETYNNVDVKELRATLLLQPTDQLTNSTILTYHWDQDIASAGPGINRLGIGKSNGLGAFYSPGYGTDEVTYGFDLHHPPTQIFGLVNTTTYALTSSLTLKNIFGFIYSAGYTNDGNTGSGVDFAPTAIDTLSPPRSRKNTQYTEELQLQGKDFDNRLTWVAGGLIDLTRQPGALDKLNYSNTDFLFGAPNSIFEQDTDDSYGLYGSGTYKITDKLNVTAGYRHSFDEVKLVTGQEPGIVLVPNPAILQRFKQSSQGDTANVSVDYHLTPDFMFYGGWRLGYKRGGFNQSSVPGAESFAPEKVNDFFVGMKSDFHVASIPVRFNVEGYYDLYQDTQVTFYTLNSFGVATVTTNVPRTTFRGLEADLTANLTGWLTLSANYAGLDAFNTSWPDNTLAGGSGDLKGNPVPFASKNKFAITPRFHTELPNNLGELALAPTISYQSKYYTVATAERLANATAALLGGQVNMTAFGGAIVPAYTLVDLRAEWNHVWGSRVDAAVNVQNLTNKLYFLGNSGSLLFGVQSNAYAPPRMVNVELSTKF